MTALNISPSSIFIMSCYSKNQQVWNCNIVKSVYEACTTETRLWHYADSVDDTAVCLTWSLYWQHLHRRVQSAGSECNAGNMAAQHASR